MSEITAKMRKIAAELLQKGEVKQVIGWEKGTFAYQSPPVFVDTPEKVECLVWDDYCVNNLAIYLLDERYTEGKTAIFVKGCDSRGIMRLLQDNQLQRERVYLIGIPCSGLKDPAQAASAGPNQEIPLATKCRECQSPNPVIFDELLGDPVAVNSTGDRFQDVKDLEAVSSDERYAFWVKQYERCLRCFACRNICPACNCTECCFDQTASDVLAKEVHQSGNQYYGLVRAFHVAGRCIECGECERVCPVDIPIMKINKKIVKDINELFGPYDAGLDLEKLPPLGQYDLNDPEKFL